MAFIALQYPMIVEYRTRYSSLVRNIWIYCIWKKVKGYIIMVFIPQTGFLFFYKSPGHCQLLSRFLLNWIRTESFLFPSYKSCNSRIHLAFKGFNPDSLYEFLTLVGSVPLHGHLICNLVIVLVLNRWFCCLLRLMVSLFLFLLLCVGSRGINWTPLKA